MGPRGCGGGGAPEDPEPHLAGFPWGFKGKHAAEAKRNPFLLSSQHHAGPYELCFPKLGSERILEKECVVVRRIREWLYIRSSTAEMTVTTLKVLESSADKKCFALREQTTAASPCPVRSLVPVPVPPGVRALLLLMGRAPVGGSSSGNSPQLWELCASQQNRKCLGLYLARQPLSSDQRLSWLEQL